MEESDVIANPVRIRAGSTLPQSTNQDSLDCSWSTVDSAAFSLRVGPDYNRNKKKEPSPPSILDLVGIDFLQSPQRIDNIGSLVDLPSEWTNYDCIEKQQALNVHPLLILNFQFPSEIPSSWLPFFLQPAVDNGPGFSVVLYCRISQVYTSPPCLPPPLHTLTSVSQATETSYLSEHPEETATAATRLLIEYLETFAVTKDDASKRDKFRGRLKLILNCKNLNDFGLPSFITAYNAKPVLLRDVSVTISPCGDRLVFRLD